MIFHAFVVPIKLSFWAISQPSPSLNILPKYIPCYEYLLQGGAQSALSLVLTRSAGSLFPSWITLLMLGRPSIETRAIRPTLLVLGELSIQTQAIQVTPLAPGRSLVQMPALQLLIPLTLGRLLVRMQDAWRSTLLLSARKRLVFSLAASHWVTLHQGCLLRKRSLQRLLSKAYHHPGSIIYHLANRGIILLSQGYSIQC